MCNLISALETKRLNANFTDSTFPRHSLLVNCLSSVRICLLHALILVKDP